MVRIARIFNVNRAWVCNSQWQYSPTHFRLNVPLLESYDETTKYIIETVNTTKSEIEIFGRIIKSEPNKNIELEYNGKKGW